MSSSTTESWGSDDVCHMNTTREIRGGLLAGHQMDPATVGWGDFGEPQMIRGPTGPHCVTRAPRNYVLGHAAEISRGTAATSESFTARHF